MIYTIKHYAEDKKAALFAFRKYIGKHFLKDELIHIATIKLWTVRWELGCVPRPIETAKNAMLNYIRQEQPNYNHDSLDSDIDGEDLMLADIIATDTLTSQEFCNYQSYIKQIFPTMNNKSKQIILLHLKHYSQAEIAERTETSRPYVHKVIQSFRCAARKLLD